MFVGGILAYVFRGKVESTIRLGMERSLNDYLIDRETTEAWDETQTRFVIYVKFNTLLYTSYINANLSARNNLLG